jgi:ethanolamine phosphate transferase 2 subunit G
VIRRWNQTGQKFAGASDIVKSILLRRPNLLGILVTATYSLAGVSLHQRTFSLDGNFPKIIWSVFLVAAAFIFKLSVTAEAGDHLPPWLDCIHKDWLLGETLVARARIAFVALTLASLWHSIRWTVTPMSRRGTWITGAFAYVHLFLLCQTRYVNTPLFMLYELQRWLLNASNSDEMWLTLGCLWMQHVSFFSLGNSNALSSIDLSNAYNGISSYSVPLVGAMTFISNWAGPIWWSMAAIQNLAERRYTISSSKADVDLYVRWLLWCGTFHGVTMSFLVGACILLRTHLFIWTVFSPKFLFQAVWIGILHIVTELGFGSIVWLMG